MKSRNLTYLKESNGTNGILVIYSKRILTNEHLDSVTYTSGNGGGSGAL